MALLKSSGVFGVRRNWLRDVRHRFGRTKPRSALLVIAGCSSTRSSRLDLGSVRLDHFINSIRKTVYPRNPWFKYAHHSHE
ncbi:MAG: hypothetical protein AB8D78_11770 [Akkermansiaceae bacterium]